MKKIIFITNNIENMNKILFPIILIGLLILILLNFKDRFYEPKSCSDLVFVSVWNIPSANFTLCLPFFFGYSDY
jgi:hypothetical protein